MEALTPGDEAKHVLKREKCENQLLWVPIRYAGTVVTAGASSASWGWSVDLLAIPSIRGSYVCAFGNPFCICYDPSDNAIHETVHSTITGLCI